MALVTRQAATGPASKRRRRNPRVAAGLTLLALALIALGVLGVDQIPFIGGEPPPPGIRLVEATTVAYFPPLATPAQPTFLAVDASGNLAAADRLGQTILRFDPNGQPIGAWGPQLGPGVVLKELAGIASSGSDWFALDRADLKVYRLDTAGVLRGTIDLRPLGPYGPNGVAADTAGNLYVADTGGNRLLMFATDGQFVKAIGSPGGDLGQLKQPTALAVDPSGGLVVADTENSRVESFDHSLQATVTWSTKPAPLSVNVDRQGRVYVPDSGHPIVRVYSPRGSLVAELGAPGSTSIDVALPESVAFGADDNQLWVLGPEGLARLQLETLTARSVAERSPDVGRIGIAAVLGVLALVLAAWAYVTRRRPGWLTGLADRRWHRSVPARRTLKVVLPPVAFPTILTNGLSVRGRVSRMRPIWLLPALVLAAAGQAALQLHPDWSFLPPAVDAAMRPMWPAAAAATAAILLFGVAMSCVALSRIDRLDPFWSTWSLPNSSQIRLPQRRASRVAFAIGLGLFGAVLAGLAARGYADWEAVALVASAGALALALSTSATPWRVNIRRLAREYGLDGLIVAAWTLAFFRLATFDLSDWYYSSIGDEHAMFQLARAIAQGVDKPDLFSQTGIYDVVPVLASAYVGALMHIFGEDGGGWKTSVVVPIALTLPFAYALARMLFGRLTAFVTLALLAPAHYLLAFAHTGAPNLEPLLSATGALCCLVYGLRRGSAVALFAAGLFAGLGWYTFYSSRVVVGIAGLVILGTVSPRRWVVVLWPFMLGFLLLFVPFVLHNGPAFVTAMLAQSSLGNSTEAVSNRSLLLPWNVGRTLLAFNYNTHNTLYTSGSLVEPGTAALFVLGLGLVLATLRDVRSRLLLIWYGVAVTATGILSQYDSVTLSRLHFALPVVVLLAAHMLSLVVRSVQQVRPRAVFQRAGTVLVGAVVVGTSYGNLHRWFVETPATVPSSQAALSIGVIGQSPCALAPMAPLIFDEFPGGALAAALDAIGKPYARAEWVPYSATALALDTLPRRCTILRSPADPEVPGLRSAIQTRYPGAQAVEQHDRAGQARVVVYFPRPPYDAASLESSNAGVAAAALSPPPVTNPPTVAPDQPAAAGTPLAPLAALVAPRGLAVLPDGTVVVADVASKQLAKLDAAGHLLGVWAGPGTFDQPFDLANDGAGHVFVLDSAGSSIEQFSGDGQFQATVLHGAGMYNPRGLALDSAGRFYVADTGRNRVLQVSAVGAVVHEWATVGGEPIDQPTGVAADGAGNFYVAEPSRKRLRKLSPDGTVLASTEVGGADTSNGPHMVLMGDGRLLVADPGAQAVRILDANLVQQQSLAAPTGSWRVPVAVAVSTDGSTAWVADAGRRDVIAVSLR